MPNLTQTAIGGILSIMDVEKKENSHEPKVVEQMSLAEFDRMFPDEASCKQYLVDQRPCRVEHLCPDC